MSKLPQIVGVEPSTLQAAKRALTESLRPRWKLYAFSILAMIGAAVFTGALAWSTRLIVNDVFVDNNAAGAIGIALLVVAVSAGKGASEYFANLFAEQFIQTISADYKRKIFHSILRRPVPDFAGVHPNHFLAQVATYSQATATAVVNLSNRFLMDTITIIALIIVMFLQDAVMTIASGILFPLIFYIVGRLANSVRHLSRAEAELQGAVSSVGAEAIQGIKTVKSYGLEEKTYQKFDDSVITLRDRMVKIARIQQLTIPLMQVLGGFIIGGFVVYASYQTLVNGRTPGEFTAFITAFLLAYQPAERMSSLIVDLQKNLVQSEQMFAILDAPEPAEATRTGTLAETGSSITLSDLKFDYGPDKPALNNISVEIQQGERIAIVGRSGAGKTTLIDLIQGFYAPTNGQVLIGDIDVNTVPYADLRKHVALIAQEVFLFDGSIRDNIRDGNPSATDSEIEEAAKRAAVTNFTKDMPAGLDSMIGAYGSGLSGGQKQRIGIARALVKNAKVYIFDEATSALDGENERAIMASTLGQKNEATTLFVTHRPSTLEWVDRIMVLEDGHLVGFDSHANLVESSEAYRTLFNLAIKAEEKPRSRYARIFSAFFKNQS